MLLGRFIFKLVPLSTFVKFRKIYRLSINKLYSPLDESGFRKVLTEDLNITTGSVVFIHSSIDNLYISFDVLRLLEILLETVGPEGTLVFPCWHFTYRAEDYLRKGEIFDVRRSPSALGMLSEMARRYPGAKRSLHPTNSIVAIGKQAEFFTEAHHTDIYPCGESSPYYRVMQLGGIIVGIGVNVHFMSFVHCVEDVMKDKFPLKTRLNELFTSKVKDSKGNMLEVKTLAAHPMIRNNDIMAFVKKHIPALICKNIQVKGNRFFRANAQLLFKEMENLAKKGITIYTKSW